MEFQGSGKPIDREAVLSQIGKEKKMSRSVKCHAVL